MRKGGTIGPGTAAGLVLVAIIILSMFIVGVNATNLLDTIKRIIYGAKIPGETGETHREKLIEAIKCSHYRCTDGCTKAISMVDYDIFPECAAEFCIGETVERCDTNVDDGKICGDEAEACPITLIVRKASISKESLKNIITCVVDDDSWWDSWWDMGTGAEGRNFVYLEKNLLDNIERDSCKYTLLNTGVNDAITEADVSGGVSIESYIGFPPVEKGPGGNRLHTITTTVKRSYEECFYSTLDCGTGCRDLLGHNEFIAGCYKLGCPPEYTDAGDYGCSGVESSCTHCCCKDLSE